MLTGCTYGLRLGQLKHVAVHSIRTHHTSVFRSRKAGRVSSTRTIRHSLDQVL